MKILVSPIDHNNFSFKLNFIDYVQRLGVSYHFEHEIDTLLCQIYDISTKDNNIIAHSDNLYHTALLFRLLRQHGYRISSSMCSSTFNQFFFKNNNFFCDATKFILRVCSLGYFGTSCIASSHHECLCL